MDLEQLLVNIEKARDAAKADAEAFDDQVQDAKHDHRTGDQLAASVARAAAQAVEGALSRILGETRRRADEL